MTDPDAQTLNIKATINNVTKSTTISAPATNKEWELSWTGVELENGEYGDIVVEVTDGVATVTATYTGKIIVDKIKPIMKIKIRER